MKKAAITQQRKTLTSHALSKADYEALASFRKVLRQYARFCELAARAEGLRPQHHQLLLAIKGMPEREWATISEVAEALQLSHHGAVQLVDRVERLDLVQRSTGTTDRRVVEVRLTPVGESALARLADQHHNELQRIGSDLVNMLSQLM